MHRRIVRRARERVHINQRNSRPLAICPACGLSTFRDGVTEQMDYRGTSVPVPTGRYACRRCIDQPQPYYKKQVLPPDPVPVVMPFPDDGPGTDTFTDYASVAALPAASSLPAGYQVDVTISLVTTRVYTDTINWRKYSNNEVVS